MPERERAGGYGDQRDHTAVRMPTDPVRCWLCVCAREAGGRGVELRLSTFQPGRHLQQVCLSVLLRPPILRPRDESSIPPHAPHRGAVAGLCMQLCVCVRARALAHPGQVARACECVPARTHSRSERRPCLHVCFDFIGFDSLPLHVPFHACPPQCHQDTSGERPRHGGLPGRAEARRAVLEGQRGVRKRPGSDYFLV